MTESDDDPLPPEISRFAPWRWAWTWRDWGGLAFLLGVGFLLAWLWLVSTSWWWKQDDF